MRLRRVVPLVAVAVLAGVAADGAGACSCFPRDPRRALQSSDGAFVGVFLSKQVLRGGDEAVFTFRVERALKGRVGRRVRVHSAASGAACGLEGRRGQRVGLLLARTKKGWASSLCNEVAPAALVAAARPLPKPNGRGPARLLVGGSFGEARLLALDAEGRTLAYGIGTGVTVRSVVCPGATRVVELVSTPNAPYRIAVRTLPALKLVRQATPTVGRRAAFVPLDCADASGSRIRGFVANGDGVISAIAELRGRVLTPLVPGQMYAAAIAGESAYVVDHDELVRIDLASGLRTHVAHVPPRTSGLVPSPDGRFVAAYQSSDPDAEEEAGEELPSAAVLVDVAAGTVRSESIGIGLGFDVAWLDPEHVAYLPELAYDGVASVFDTALQRVGKVAPWRAEVGAVLDGAAWGVVDGLLTRAAFPAGSQRVVRDLGSPEVWSIAAVDGSSAAVARARAVCPARAA